MKDRLIFEHLFDDGYHLWFTERDYNALFCMDKECWNPKLVSVFPKEKIMQKNLYSAITFCNEKLYFAPSSANEIAEYNLKTEKIRKIAIPTPCIDNNQLWRLNKFSNVISVGNKVFFIPFFYPGILCYNTETDRFECFDDWIGKIENIRASEWGYFKDIEWAVDKLILPCICADAVVIFDVVTEEFWIIKTPDTDYLCKHCGIYYTGQNYYLVSADGTVSKRRLDSEEEIKRIKVPVSGVDGIEFYPVKYANGCIYLFPSKNSRGFKIDIKTDEVISAEVFDDEKNCGDNPLYIASEFDGEKLYVLTGNSHCFIVYDFKKERKQEFNLFISEQDNMLIEKLHKEELITQLYDKGVRENEGNSLLNMLDILQTHNNLFQRCDKGRKIKIGSRIYNGVICGE